MNRTYRKYAAFFLVPVLICFIATFIIPFVYGVLLSFFGNWFSDYNFANMTFVGFKNYAIVFNDIGFRHAFVNTFLFSFVSVFTINLFAFIIAMLLTRGKKLTNFFRTIFFMPNLIGGIILGLIWQIILNGIISNLFGKDLFVWSQQEFGFWGLVILMNWQLIGYMSIIYIASIQNINNDLLEAADIDGASLWQKMIHIILPSVMPAVTICLFLTITNTFKLYDQNYALTGGLPMSQSEPFNYLNSLLALDIVKTFSESDKFKYYPIAQTKAVVFFLFVGFISCLQVFFTRRKEIEA